MTRPLSVCAVGLLLTVVELRVFGVDLTDDAVGFALVLRGVLGLPATRARIVAAVGAAAAALVSLIGYGAPAAQLLPAAFPGWVLVAQLRAVATATTVVALLVLMRPAMPALLRRVTPFLAGAYAIALVGWLCLVSGEQGFTGTLGLLRQLLAAGLGAAPIAVVAVALLFPEKPFSTWTHRAKPHSQDRPLPRR